MATIEAGSRADAAACARTIADSFRSPGFDVAVEAGAALPPARITPEVLDTVIETLVDNSRNAGAHRVEIALRPQGSGVALRIADDGCGIAEADRARIFEPFFTGRREHGGTGLGLAIARSLIEASGGSIASEAAAKGAVFALWLPAAGR
jgi:signal transduction histidine kinase